jgi:NAD+ kinase
VKLAVHANPNKPAAVEIARRLIAAIARRAELVVSDELPGVAPELEHRSLAALDAAVLLAIGGDGTFLHALRRAPVPLLPINAGTLGVLSEVDGRRADEVDRAVERLLAGDYFVEDRMKLAAEIPGASSPDAMNEFLVHAARVGKTSWFEIAFDGVVSGRVRADGLIVGTPTGSTAYALSSLGPVVEPTVDAIVLTAIAPFRVEARALVIDPLRTVEVRVVDGASDCVVLPDGDGEFPLPAGRRAVFYASPRRARFVRLGASFFDRLSGKRILPWGPDAVGGPGAVLPPSP